MKQPLVILTGPTAVGKTALSIELARRIGGEIISADSMQVYKGMDIGSAKIMPEEMQGIPHYLIDELEPGGLLIYDSALVTSRIERDDITAVGIPAGDIALEVGSPKVANVIINGVIIGLMGIVSQETFQQSLDLKFAKKSEEVRALNRKALQTGIDYANSHR